MKPNLLLFLFVLSFCHPLMADATAVPLHSTEEAQIKGDANGDGLVNISDVSFVINILLGKADSEYTLEAVDVNSDGFINISDVMAIIHILLGYDDTPNDDDPPIEDDDANPNLPVLIPFSSLSPPPEAD